jgi:DNA invertase Pin-like site-specific DNA recombinase
MDGYIRVSRLGGRDVDSESYITEDVQRDKIETWAKLRGVEIVAWHIDRDQSGSKLTRPGFDTCMTRISEGKTEGVVVAQIDRLSRADVADALMIVRKIHDDYNGTVAAVDLGIDPTTEVGEMLLTVLLALARMQWRRYAAAWATSKERAIKRGAHIGPTPIGYKRANGGRLEPDPATAPVIRTAFSVAASVGLTAAMEYLQTTSLRNWTAVTVRRTIQSRVYLGEVRYGIDTNPSAHEPLVDLSVWTAANKNVEGKKDYRLAGNYPLSQVATCASCGDALVGHQMSSAKRAYRCRRNKHNGAAEPCPAPAMASADALEEYVQAALLRYVATQRSDETSTLVAGGDERAVEQEEASLRSAELARNQDATDIRLREILGETTFYERMEAHNWAIASAQQAYEKAVAEAQPELTWPLTDEVATATADDLPALLERCDLVVRLAPGRGNLPERVSLD